MILNFNNKMEEEVIQQDFMISFITFTYIYHDQLRDEKVYYYQIEYILYQGICTEVFSKHASLIGTIGNLYVNENVKSRASTTLA